MQATSFTLSRAALPQRHVAAPRARRSSVIVRADYLGSATNQIFVLATTLSLVAGRFGLAPTANRHTTAGLKLYDDKSAGLGSSDPAGFTATDVLALGAFGHIVATGIVLGLKGTGTL